MSMNVLIVSTMDGIERNAEQIAEQTGCGVQVAGTKRGALATLTRSDFDVLVVEHSMVESDPEWADRLWQNAGTAMPVQLNFGISGAARLVREVRGALTRRNADRTLARKAVALDLANELKSPLTGLLLQSELALHDPAMPAAMEPKLRHLVELASQIRERLRYEA